MSQKCAYAPPSVVSTDDATCGTPMWRGKGFTCVCFKPRGSYQRMCINLTPFQEERLKRLKRRMKVYFDTSRSEHREALRALWNATFPGKELHNLVSDQWKEMGWQGRDPSTDFRGAGFISLENLLFFAKTFSTSFQNLLKKQGGKRATWEYPFAVAGVNITFMIMQMLELHSSKRDTLLSVLLLMKVVNKISAKPTSVARSVFIQMLSENEWAFDLLYCVAFVVMDKQWLQRNATYMEFNMIWDEVGEDQCEREKILLVLEQECLEVYRKKVDSANDSRAQLNQQLAESEAKYTQLLLSLGERPLPRRPEKMRGALKEQIALITPALREMQLRKQERLKQFRAVQGQIQKILAEIEGQSDYNTAPSHVLTNEKDLSKEKLEEYQRELQRFQKEKNDRLQRVNMHLSTIQNLSSTLGMDSSLTITKIHPSLNDLSGLSKNISDNILANLSNCVESLEAEKKNRLEKLHHLGKELTNLWNLMDTPYGYRQLFSHVTSLLSTSSAEISDPRSLTTDLIQQAEVEVKRLDQQKTTKMKELFVNKQIELEEICKRSHMEIPSQPEMDNIMNLMNSGVIDYADLLASMDKQIQRAEEEAFSRKAIMEKVEKWILACDEERWLEEYMTDENRYSVSRGAHKNLKRAERARVMVNKIPSLMDLLIAKTKSWEEERNKVFLYDQIPLLVMLEDYNVLRQEKEKEKQRQKEKKKVQNLVYEEESLFGPRPGTGNRHLSDKSISRSHGNAAPLDRRLTLSIQQLGSSNNYPPTQSILSIKEGKRGNQLKKFARSTTASHFKEETITMVSTISGSLSP